MNPWFLLGGMALKVLDREQKKREKRKMDLYNQAVVRYAPWTGMSPVEAEAVPGMGASLLQGAATGALLGSYMPEAAAPATKIAGIGDTMGPPGALATPTLKTPGAGGVMGPPTPAGMGGVMGPPSNLANAKMSLLAPEMRAPNPTDLLNMSEEEIELLRQQGRLPASL